jgi:hypothetical protein
VSLTPMQGSAITYAIKFPPESFSFQYGLLTPKSATT